MAGSKVEGLLRDLMNLDKQVRLAVATDRSGKIECMLSAEGGPSLSSEEVYMITVPVVVGVAGKLVESSGNLRYAIVSGQRFTWIFLPWREHMLIIACDSKSTASLVERAVALCQGT